MAPPGFLCQSDNNHGPLGSVFGLRKSAQIFGWTLRSGRCSPVVVSCRAGAFQASHRFPRFVKSCGIHRWKQFQDERLSIIRIIGNNHFRFTSSFIPSITPACPTCPTPYLGLRCASMPPSSVLTVPAYAVDALTVTAPGLFATSQFFCLFT